MALYKCLNSSCENYNLSTSVQSESPMFECPHCGKTMWREDLRDTSKKDKYDSKNPYPSTALVNIGQVEKKGGEQ